MAYKKNIDDYRESPSLFIMDKLLSKKYKVEFHDKLVKKVGPNRHFINLKNKKSIRISEKIIKEYDLVLILTDHDYIDYEMLKKNAKLLIDTRNRVKYETETIIKM